MNQPNFKTTARSKKEAYAEFVLESLPRGYGHTLGNSLRRALLTSLPGAAVTQVKIKGARHPFSTLPGLKNDVIELILNIKKIRIKLTKAKKANQEKSEGFKMKLSASGPGEFKAAKITTPPQLEIINKGLVLGYLADKKSKIEMEMTVEEGVGYQISEEQEKKIGVIPVDAIFTPVLRVAYQVEETRVGRRTDFDKLILKIWTDGSLEPQEALNQAAQTLVGYFKQIYKPTFEEKKEEGESLSLDVAHLSVEELGLPTRVVNALSRAGFKTVRDLASASIEDIKKAKSIGQKSLKIVKRKLKDKEVELRE